MSELIRIRENSVRPKYKQIVSSIIVGIETGVVRRFEKLPSINEVSASHDISRDTVEKAYRELLQRNFIESTPGVGYFISSQQGTGRKKIFVLINTMSSLKRAIYNAFVQTLGEKAQVELFVHHNQPSIFKDLLQNLDKSYTHYVFFPGIVENYPESLAMIRQIPAEKVLFINRRLAGLSDGYAAAYQAFEHDVFQCLHEAGSVLAKYRSIRLLFPCNNFYPAEIIKGTSRFCLENSIPYSTVTKWEDFELKRHTVYLTLNDDDLVQLIKLAQSSGLQVGKDIGILSYNDNPLKEILLHGISVITTDFEAMGRTAAKLILGNRREQVANPCKLILRKSL